MYKLSDDQKAEITKLFPLNNAINYDKDHIKIIFKRLENVLKNSCVSFDKNTQKPTKDGIKNQITIIATIQNN
ncbi:MAG TPA: hypothetical protein VN030_08050, partial [Cellvibrio sp.]|nr:hypothetical protein [Cellvibrio sp.]